MYIFRELLLNGRGFGHHMESWSCPWFYGHFGPLGMVLAWLVLVLIIAGLVYGVVKLLGYEYSPVEKNVAAEDPLQQLKSRLARGEITEEEYESKKEKLEE